MTSSKSIRISEKVYKMVAECQLPRESISGTIERLLGEREAVVRHAKAMLDALRQKVEEAALSK